MRKKIMKTLTKIKHWYLSLFEPPSHLSDEEKEAWLDAQAEILTNQNRRF